MNRMFASRTYTPRPHSKGLSERAHRVLPGGVTRSTVDVSPYPPYLVSGEGARVVDADGHTLIDLQNNYTSLVHGHARREIVDAAIGAVQSGSAFGLPTGSEVLLAELLVTRFSAIERVRFTNSGTEAVMMALRAARTYTGRATVIRFQSSYHGTADDAVDATSSSERVVVVPFNDPVALRRTAREVGANLAGILVDVMPNRAGLQPVSDELLVAVADCAADMDALVISDEVITARLAFEGAAAARGLHPDLVTLGKVIGGGFPVGAFGGKQEIMRVFERESRPRVDHGGTFTANPVSMTAGRVALELFEHSEIERINSLGETLRSTASELGFAMTGRGSLMRIHSANDTQMWWAAYDAGLLIGNNGLIALSTAMDDGVIDEVTQRLDQLRIAMNS